jgi:hypothetical protein
MEAENEFPDEKSEKAKVRRQLPRFTEAIKGLKIPPLDFEQRAIISGGVEAVVSNSMFLHPPPRQLVQGDSV